VNQTNKYIQAREAAAKAVEVHEVAEFYFQDSFYNNMTTYIQAVDKLESEMLTFGYVKNSFNDVNQLLDVVTGANEALRARYPRAAAGAELDGGSGAAAREPRLLNVQEGVKRLLQGPAAKSEEPAENGENSEKLAGGTSKPKRAVAADSPRVAQEKAYLATTNNLMGKVEDIKKYTGLSKEISEDVDNLNKELTAFLKLGQVYKGSMKTLNESLITYLFEQGYKKEYNLTELDITFMGWLAYSRHELTDWEKKPNDKVVKFSYRQHLNKTDFVLMKGAVEAILKQHVKKTILKEKNQAAYAFEIMKVFKFNVTDMKNITNCTNGFIKCPCAANRSATDKTYCDSLENPDAKNETVSKDPSPATPTPAPPSHRQGEAPAAPVSPDQPAANTTEVKKPEPPKVIPALTAYTAFTSLLGPKYVDDPDLKAFTRAFLNIVKRVLQEEIIDGYK
jgi:hypothetical protein